MFAVRDTVHCSEPSKCPLSSAQGTVRLLDPSPIQESPPHWAQARRLRSQARDAGVQAPSVGVVGFSPSPCWPCTVPPSSWETPSPRLQDELDSSNKGRRTWDGVIIIF